MGLGAEIVDTHVAEWTKKLKSGNRPYRRHWPGHLFRHEALENLVGIIQQGTLLSRTHAVERNLIERDVAPEDIIGRRNEAHRYVRLYFRPKTPTQFRIEGILKPDEVYLGRHAPVLYILVFNAPAILTLPDTRFSDGNMQSPRTRLLDGDRHFAQLPFKQIYHDGRFTPGTETGDEIKLRRCAEVLAPSPLPLDSTLRGIMCRSVAERSTLLHALGDRAPQWAGRVRVFSQPGLFNNRRAYVETVNGTERGLKVTVHPRRDGKPVTIQVRLTSAAHGRSRDYGALEIDPSKTLVISEDLRAGRYIVEIELEGCLAHRHQFMIDDLPF